MEVVYVITSMPSTDASPTQIAARVLGRWSIENRLRWVRAIVFDEDRSTVRTGQGPRVMATLRSTATRRSVGTALFGLLAAWDGVPDAARAQAPSI